jgi:hypothetical protein
MQAVYSKNSVKTTVFLRKNQTALFLSLFSLLAIVYSGISTEKFLPAIVHFVVILVSGSAFFWLLRLLTKKKKLFSNTLITLLIVALLLHPLFMPQSLLMASVVAFFAVAVKFFGEYKNVPFLNPAVAAVMTASAIAFFWEEKVVFVVNSWWGATFFPVGTDSFQVQISLVLLVLWAFFGLRTYKKVILAACFLVSLFVALLFFTQESAFVTSLFTDATIYFLLLSCWSIPNLLPSKSKNRSFLEF